MHIYSDRSGTVGVSASMAPKLLTFVIFLAGVLPAADAAIDIGKILGEHREFSLFSSLLASTGVARATNSREAVTVLAPNNTAVVAALRGVPRGADTRALLADVLSLHVILEYIDADKLEELGEGRSGDGTLVTTLLQANGKAQGRYAGFLHITIGEEEDDRVTFTSAAIGSPWNATFERAIAQLPPSVSVLQVSGFIFPPGVIPPQPRARQTSMPPAPSPARAPAAGPMAQPPLQPALSPGPKAQPPLQPLLPAPAPARPTPATPNLTNTPPPLGKVIPIPIPSVDGGMTATLPPAAGHRVASSWSVAGLPFGLVVCLVWSL
ncbi:hypothetical protein ABZP36_031662 [Zizania latifolia]